MDKLTKAFLAEKTRDRLEEALTATTEPCTVATIQHILSSSPQEKSSILKLTNGNGDTALHKMRQDIRTHAPRLTANQ